MLNETKTIIGTDSVELWLAELALLALRGRFPNPDYRFRLEPTQHITNPTCLPHVRRVRIVCRTYFTPSVLLVAAWRNESSLR
jgi:hypothetical protein